MNVKMNRVREGNDAVQAFLPCAYLAVFLLVSFLGSEEGRRLLGSVDLGACFRAMVGGAQ